LLAGAVPDWVEHLPRIARMGFDWVYLNPFHYPGFSGSLYAIKDPGRLHPVAQGDADGDPAELLKGFTAAAAQHGVKAMADLVINHASKDALLVEQKPHWFARDSSGALRSPRAVDPDDPRKATVWGDLAEIDYRPEVREEQASHWSAEARRYLDQGFAGFRCDAAYKVPADVWRRIIADCRRVRPDCLFAAETLGCTLEQVADLHAAGFDYLFNSAKWWDFRSRWLLDQYELHRRIAPSIAFPESHDTERLAAELDGLEPERVRRAYRQRDLFAAAFSSGVMMPMGYEFGFRRRLDVIEARPEHWAAEAAEPRFDLTEFIGAVNRMKASAPALNVEGRQVRISAPDARAVALLRVDADDQRCAGHAAIALFNPDPRRPARVEVGPLIAAAGGAFEEFSDATPLAEPVSFRPGDRLALEPLAFRLFVAQARPAAGAPRPAEAARGAMDALAQRRVAIEAVYPELDGGRFPAKRVVGDVLEVWADVFSDGHDKIAAALKCRAPGEPEWREAPMAFGDNDRWVGRFPLTRMGRWLYTIEAWRDLYATWRADTAKKVEANLDVALETIEGRALIEKAGADGLLARLDAMAERERLPAMLSPEFGQVMARLGPRTNLTRYERELELVVDREAARFGAWYEMFPRSQSGDPRRHGTFVDVIAKLPYVRELGFDVLYFTPIHPIGRANRKGRNNSLHAGPDDPGSVYAIGSEEGGHRHVHSELGTLEDFRKLVAAAQAHGLEIAIDFAVQCAPDHPWLKRHPEWFDWRPDGTVKYAENPPKKYEDIVNVHFYRGAYPSIWLELRDIVLFWCGQGVRIFRVDNPHTKPLPFWEWMIREVQDRHPDAIFLAEAFTRPKMMRRLAKLGFTQSYTYFTWRNLKDEIVEYVDELAHSQMREYYRPNFFVNTPDINPPILQTGGRPAHIMRACLAATLSSLWGVYNGFEICEATPVPGKEEYLDSEKYEIRAWDFDRPGNIRGFIARLNRIRRENPALRDWRHVRFYNAWNDSILYYGRLTPDLENFVLVAVNLDPHNAHETDFEIPLWEFGLPDEASIEAEDLLTDRRFTWRGKVQRMRLDPQSNPCAIWRLTPPERA
jgi:starch synthase (maltosyl-transferring)